MVIHKKGARKGSLIALPRCTRVQLAPFAQRILHQHKLCGKHAHVVTNRFKLSGEQVRHASRYGHKRVLGKARSTTHGLARLGLGLARHGAGVDGDDVGLVLGAQNSARLDEGALHPVGLHAVDATAKVDDTNVRGNALH